MDHPRRLKLPDYGDPFQKELDADSPFKPFNEEHIQDLHHIRVYPPIGIARVGSADFGQSWIGPEYQQLFPATREYKHDNKIKKMACRFRVFGFNEANQPLGEITQSAATQIKWHVNLVNSKSAFWKFQNFAAIVSSKETGSALEGVTAWKANGLRNPTIEGNSYPSERTSLIINTSGSVEAGHTVQPLIGVLKAFEEEDIVMGLLHLANDGSLAVNPADGTAKQFGDTPLTDDFNTPGWWDTTSDGSIDVEVQFTHDPHPRHFTTKNGNYGGWLLVGPPKYAPDMVQPTSIYDGIQNLFGGALDDFSGNKPGYQKGTTRFVSFYKDVFPILRRPTELAWTNPDAFGGHGPGGPADFTSQSWLKRLSDPSDAGSALRKEVFFRLRSPDPEIAKGQADRRWMPRLSGNGGRCTSGDPTTWASLTPWQYEILRTWSEGNFEVEEKDKAPSSVQDKHRGSVRKTKDYAIDFLKYDYYDENRFKELPIDEQLQQAIKGPLIYGTGQPVYPGIEVSWTYLLFQTYGENQPFRINRKNIQPGELNRLLSCPWQSDFYLCRNHWWPACRPDSVVPASEYERIMKGDKASVVPWERGIRPQHGDKFADLELVSNVDMIRHWEKLGFVGRKDLPAKKGEVVYIEQEREDFYPLPLVGLIPSLDNNRLLSVLWDLMKFELSTVPAYLYAAWSIKVADGEYGPFQLASNNGLTPEQNKAGGVLRRAILNIVSEEMLHLSLAGNLLTALGFRENIELAQKESLPVYPGQITRHPTGWILNLAPLNEDQLKTFIQVEAPAPGFGAPVYSENSSIAETYAFVTATLEKRGDAQKYQDADYQFGPGEVYSPRVHDTGGSVKVTNFASAKKAVETICAQGEGMVDDMAFSPFTDPLHQELSHYQRFKSALEEIKSGKVLIWDMPTNPGANRKEYPPELKAVDDLFNAVYLYLLKVIDRLYRTDVPILRKELIWQGMFPAMTSILTGLADILIHSKLPSGTQAGPTFSFYNFPVDAPCWALHIQKELFPSVRYACTKNGEILERLNVVQVPLMNLKGLAPDHDKYTKQGVMKGTVAPDQK